MNPAHWPAHKAKLAAVFRTKTRDAWAEIFAESDGCVVPVLSMDEAPHHPHNQARGNFRLQDGAAEPTPAPRFSRSQAKPSAAPPLRGEDNAAILRDFGFSAVEIEQLLKAS
jgi:alpha-methylacyl-CoA racemase